MRNEEAWRSGSACSGRRRAVVVSQSGVITRLMKSALQTEGFIVSVPQGRAECMEALRRSADLLCCDLSTERELAGWLFERALEQRPAPALIAIGTASMSEAFRLGALGVRHLFERQVEPEAIRERLRTAVEEPPRIDGILLRCVGQYARSPGR
jgi:DNA-binding NtrC family response regulator